MTKEHLNYIEYKGYKYWYEQKTAKHGVDICLATKNPKEYCNGFYLYSDKDPSNGTPFVVVKTNNPNLNRMKQSNKQAENKPCTIQGEEAIQLIKKGADVSNFDDPMEWQKKARTERKINGYELD